MAPPRRRSFAGERVVSERTGMLETFADLSTPLVADACIRSGVPLRVAPAGIGAVVAGYRIAGRALPGAPLRQR